MKTSPFLVTPLFLALSLISFGQDAHAESGNIALGAKISTLGVGPDLSIGILDSLNIRASGHWGTYSVDGESEDISYECDLNLLSGLVTAEWFPFDGRSFHIVGGVLINGNNLDTDTTLISGLSYEIGGTTYTADNIGTLTGEIDYNTLAPYIGIGWGNPLRKDSNWTFFVDLGVAYQGAADVELTATGVLATDPTFLSDLQQEEDDLEDDLENFKYYPVISLGVTYKF